MTALVPPPEHKDKQWHLLRNGVIMQSFRWFVTMETWDEGAPENLWSSGWRYFAPLDPDAAATIVALREENAALISDNAKFIAASTELATENERLRADNEASLRHAEDSDALYEQKREECAAFYRELSRLRALIDPENAEAVERVAMTICLERICRFSALPEQEAVRFEARAVLAVIREAGKP